jgi:hypothetical protein
MRNTRHVCFYILFISTIKYHKRKNIIPTHCVFPCPGRPTARGLTTAKHDTHFRIMCLLFDLSLCACAVINRDYHADLSWNCVLYLVIFYVTRTQLHLVPTCSGAQLAFKPVSTGLKWTECEPDHSLRLAPRWSYSSTPHTSSWLGA